MVSEIQNVTVITRWADHFLQQSRPRQSLGFFSSSEKHFFKQQQRAGLTNYKSQHTQNPISSPTSALIKPLAIICLFNIV